MILVSIDHSPILDLPAISRAMVRLYGEASVAAPRYDSSPSVEGWVSVNPPDESSFSVRLGSDHAGAGVDGLPYQNERVAAALRSEIPENAPRIIAIEPDRDAFVDLPWGVTAEEIAAGWRHVSEFDENEQVGLGPVVPVGAGGHQPDSTGSQSPQGGEIAAAEQPPAHRSWVEAPSAPRPGVVQVFGVDMARWSEVQAALRPSTRYDLVLPDETVAACYTDERGRLGYVETGPGTVAEPSPVLGSPSPEATYVVHPLDGFTVVLRTDEQGRLTQVVADRLPPVGTYSPEGYSLPALVGRWPGQVSPSALLETVSEPAAARLRVHAAYLADAVNQGRQAAVRVLAGYDGTGTAPAWLQVDSSVDGQVWTEPVSNR